jgi:ABC-type sugar transport system ATPase subunit
MTMADQIVVMHDGIVEQTGGAAGALRPPDRFRRQP